MLVCMVVWISCHIFEALELLLLKNGVLTVAYLAGVLVVEVVGGWIKNLSNILLNIGTIADLGYPCLIK